MFIYKQWQDKLKTMPAWFISIYAAICSFGVYFCMYAFRKPFTAASFEGMSFLHIEYKVWLVTAQVIGYMLSKFYGIKFISGMKGEKRASTIVLLITIGWVALLLFAITPAPYSIIFLLINGFPLGMVWGLTFSFLEGRRATEFMGAVLSISFIFSSGVVKSAGKSVVLDWHITETWMPFITGALFMLPMIIFTWLLNHTPPPSEKDIQSRTKRKPMTAKERSEFLAMFMPGIVIIVTTYVLLTVLRDFRDNFANELWGELGYANNAAIFTKTEIPVSIIVLACMSLLILVKSNIKAFMINHYIVMFGYALTLGATICFSKHMIDPVVWMTLIGTGLYLSYVPFNALYFERMIASYRVNSNVGFIMYIADSFGYLGSVLVLFIKEFSGMHLSWTAFFIKAIIIVTTIGIVGTFMASVYFRRKYLSRQSSIQTFYA